MNVSIIIINWNSQTYLRQCILSIASCCDLRDTEIIVVDNGSFDGSDRMVAADFPAVRFFQAPVNLGFARANNFGARHAHGRHLLFLNPDTLLTGDTPRVLASRLANLPYAGGIGGRILNADRTVQTSCIQSFPTPVNQLLDAEWLRRRFPRSPLWGTAALHQSSPAPVRVAAISGACLMVSAAAFHAVGGFTEAYFMYGEDIDLCRKLHAAGWRVFYTPETSLVHFGGGSSRLAPGEFSVVMMRVAVHRFIRVHEGRAAAAAYRGAMAIAAFLRLLALAPLRLRRGSAMPAAAARKWFAILRWSLGLLPGHAAALRTPTPALTPS